MASAAKSKVSVDELVKQALLKIARSESPLRLSGKGDGFVFSGTSAVIKEAIARLKSEAQPFVVEHGDGKTATVALTRAGLEQILDSIPTDNFVEVVARFARQTPPSARVVFLQELVRKNPQSVSGLVSLLEQAVAAEEIERVEHAKVVESQRATEAASLAALERWKKLLEERKRQRIDALQHELRAEGVEPDPIQPQPRSKGEDNPVSPPLSPASSEDRDFRRNVARRLVSSWVDAWDAKKPEGREFLEAAIWNVSGFRQVGAVGERLSFDGRYHEGGAGLFTNDPVQVARPGWVLEEGDETEYVVLKALVVK